jgi:hypothetical protein
MACLIAPIATVLIINRLENKDKIMVRGLVVLFVPSVDFVASFWISCVFSILYAHHILSLAQLITPHLSRSSVSAREAYKSK